MPMRIVMMGTGTFAEPTFEALLTGPHPVVGLVTQPDRAAGHERGSTRQTGLGMKTIALEHSLPVFQPESVNTPEGVEGVRAFQPDLLVVAAYGQILSRDVLAKPWSVQCQEPFPLRNLFLSGFREKRFLAPFPVTWGGGNVIRLGCCRRSMPKRISFFRALRRGRA
jgi:hypothetical protein